MLYLRIGFAVVIIFLGALLGDGYKNNLFLYWLISLICFVVYSEVITNILVDLKGQLETYKEKVSTLSILKGNSGNVIQLAVMPPYASYKNRYLNIDVFVTSAVPITSFPDIKLKTNVLWDVKVSNQVQQGHSYAGKFEYVLNNQSVTSIGDKFFKFSFDAKFASSGDYDFLIEINNGSVTGEIQNKITVR